MRYVIYSGIPNVECNVSILAIFYNENDYELAVTALHYYQGVYPQHNVLLAYETIA